MNATSKPVRPYSTGVLLAILLLSSSLRSFAATGHFDVYCDGVGLFLHEIDAAPAPKRLVLFSRLPFPPGTMAGDYLGQAKWVKVTVYRNGCVPNGKCESVANGRVWIDDWRAVDADYRDHKVPKTISGKYEVDLDGKHLEGRFIVKQHRSRRPLRICM